jgi:type II secretory pathway pseudopilin PulG
VFNGITGNLWSLFWKKDRGFSLVEVVLVLAVSIFLFTALTFLLLRTGVTKLANENVLAASTLAEDVLERIRKKSVDDFDGLTALIGSNDTLEIPLSTFVTQVPDRFKDRSSIIFEVLQRNPSNTVEKVSARVIIKWKEAKGWSGSGGGGGTVRNVQEREYVLNINIAKSGLRTFLK